MCLSKAIDRSHFPKRLRAAEIWFRTVWTDMPSFSEIWAADVQSSLDFDNYIATLSCSFNDVKALNAFSKILSAHFKVELSTYSSYSYDPAARVFGRNYTYNAEVKKEFAKLKTDNQESFNQAHFTSIYRFQDHVARQQHANAKISPNKKAVMLKVRATDLINGKVNLSNRITLSK